MIKGNNPTLLNVTYVRPSKRNDYHEAFEVIYKTEDGKVHYSEEPAEADIYIVKPEFRNYTYNKPQERIENMEKVRVKISKIREEIAKAQGDAGKEFIKQCRQTGDYKRMNQLFRWRFAYGCDFQPEYYFMKNWYEKYPLGNVKLTKAYLDIEIDQIDHTVDMDNLRDTAYAPVNCVTVLLDETLDSYTFILNPQEPSRMGRSDEEYQRRYSLYERQRVSHERLINDPSSFIQDLRESFSTVYGHWNYHVRTYQNEIELIADIFALLNTRNPNYCLSWNMRFDIQYLYYRIIALGYDPASIMCHPDFKDKKCYFKADNMAFKIEKQVDYFYCSSYIQYICQMRNYGSVRKSQHTIKSFKLNDIADKELGQRKVEYDDFGSINTFMYEDWRRFIKYNIKDTLLQFGIERKTNDVMVYYLRSHVNLTPYNKIFKETHLLRNVREIYFEKEGWVQGNNLNSLGSDEDETARRFYLGDSSDDEESGTASYKGAIMADPLWNDRVGMLVLGVLCNNIFMNAMDYDMEAFYPSIKIACNMDPGTLLFKATFINEEFISGQYTNRSLCTKYEEKDKNSEIRRLDITGEAVNTYVSGNILTFGYNYLNLPSATAICMIVEVEYNEYDMVG